MPALTLQLTGLAGRADAAPLAKPKTKPMKEQPRRTGCTMSASSSPTACGGLTRLCLGPKWSQLPSLSQVQCQSEGAARVLEGATLPTPAPGWMKQGSSYHTSQQGCAAGLGTTQPRAARAAVACVPPSQQILCVSLHSPPAAGPGQCQTFMVISALLANLFFFNLLVSFASTLDPRAPTV